MFQCTGLRMITSITVSAASETALGTQCMRVLRFWSARELESIRTTVYRYANGKSGGRDMKLSGLKR